MSIFGKIFIFFKRGKKRLISVDGARYDSPAETHLSRITHSILPRRNRPLLSRKLYTHTARDNARDGFVERLTVAYANFALELAALRSGYEIESVGLQRAFEQPVALALGNYEQISLHVLIEYKPTFAAAFGLAADPQPPALTYGVI